MKNLPDILKIVEKPSRYIGGEYGEPDIKWSDFNFCMCFPDVYEVGMSNLGIRIVMDSINSKENMIADRCFAPWTDFGDLIKENNILLYSLGLKKNLKDFDMLGFTLQYEMSYTNILYMLDLAAIPFYSDDRDEKFPIIACGGPCSVNPEPLADFVDMFFIGDGEENVAKAGELFIKQKKQGNFSKEKYLLEASKIEGVYIPKFLKVEYSEDNTIKSFSIDKKIKKAVVKDLDASIFPKKMMVANNEAVHDRAVIEVMRGCYRGCRFCQAGFTYRPVRKRSVEKLVEISKSLIKNTGFDELSLNSLSTGDYKNLKELIPALKINLPKEVQIALPSLRVDNFESQFALESRRSSLTFAPEAGSQRLRDVINKDITLEEIEKGVTSAFDLGYFNVKLYFMLGLPTETEEDLLGIRKIAERITEIYNFTKGRKKSLNISISVSTFIPKPFTPFQLERQATKEEVIKKQQFLRENLRLRGVRFSWSDYNLSNLEAVFARGDRKLSKVLELAYLNGARYDSWDEKFNIEAWDKAFIDSKINREFYTREFSETEILPWDFIDVFVSKEFFINERRKAFNAEVTGCCKESCKGCGVQREFRCEK